MSFQTPAQIVETVNQIAKAKQQSPIKKTFILGILAGAYIAIGGLLAVSIGGGVPEIAANNPGLQKLLFGGVFPLGLMLVAIAGAELFTGNTAYFVPEVLSKRMSFKVPLKNWGIVYLGNFIGSLLVAYLFAYLAGTFEKDPWLSTVKSIGVAKTSAPFMKIFFKAIACNWLVALAMWLSFAAKDITGKILGIWFPIMGFVAMGFEHCVANMFFIPTAIFYGADISWTSFLVDNLIPATLGNIVGGALFVGGAYWFVYDRK